MKIEHVVVQYRLTCVSPLHCGTGMRQGLIHRSIVRDPKGFIYVPGSTLKGVLRDHATRLAHLLGLEARYPHNLERDAREFAARGDIVALIFGSRFRPGTLFFDDARLCDTDRDFFRSERDNRLMANQSETRTQVSLSRRTGTARRSFLFTTEYGVPYVDFAGRIYGTLSGVPTIEGTTTYSLILLLAALSSLEYLGGNKSAGAGRMTCTITELQVDQEILSIDDYITLLPEFEYYTLAEEEDG